MIRQYDVVRETKRFTRMTEPRLRRLCYSLMEILDTSDLIKLYIVAKNYSLYGFEKKSREILLSRGINIED